MLIFKKLLIVSLTSLFIGCGLGSVKEKEDAGKKKKEDSLIEIERGNALNNADKLLKQSDSLEQAKTDSINKLSTKGKK